MINKLKEKMSSLTEKVEERETMLKQYLKEKEGNRFHMLATCALNKYKLH